LLVLFCAVLLPIEHINSNSDGHNINPYRILLCEMDYLCADLFKAAKL
jgi:hypothetical protein